jgi:hypothetical protein
MELLPPTSLDLPPRFSESDHHGDVEAHPYTIAQSHNTPAIRQYRTRIKYDVSLFDKANRPWATISLAGNQLYPKNPTFLEGEKIDGSVKLSLGHAETINSISVTAITHSLCGYISSWLTLARCRYRGTFSRARHGRTNSLFLPSQLPSGQNPREGLGLRAPQHPKPAGTMGNSLENSPGPFLLSCPKRSFFQHRRVVYHRCSAFQKLSRKDTHVPVSSTLSP